MTGMSAMGEVLVGVAIAVGIAGVVIPVLPGTLLVGAAIGVWAAFTGGVTAWTVFAIAAFVIALSAVGKYVAAERHLRGSGVPRSTMVVGAACGVVGFFVIPIVGLVVGFVAGVYLAERHRLDNGSEAWRATVAALKASGLAMLIELAGGLVAAGVWVSGLAVT
jgi:uncharacterized protein YqgC (DUF456 family)